MFAEVKRIKPMIERNKQIIDTFHTKALISFYLNEIYFKLSNFS